MFNITTSEMLIKYLSDTGSFGKTATIVNRGDKVLTINIDGRSESINLSSYLLDTLLQWIHIPGLSNSSTVTVEGSLVEVDASDDLDTEGVLSYSSISKKGESLKNLLDEGIGLVILIPEETKLTFQLPENEKLVVSIEKYKDDDKTTIEREFNEYDYIASIGVYHTDDVRDISKEDVIGIYKTDRIAISTNGIVTITDNEVIRRLEVDYVF